MSCATKRTTIWTEGLRSTSFTRATCAASRPLLVAGWIALVLLLLPAAAAAEEEIEVFLRLPKYGEALYGDVEVGADVYPEEVEIDRVEFYLDDRLVGIDQDRPFEQVLDAGQENVEHVFMVQVYAEDGRIARSSVPTPRTRTDEVVEIELQQLYVAVEDDGERVLDLPRGEFRIFDNGVEQEIVTFESGDVPFTAVILVDASESMRGGRLEVALEGARSFVGGFAELDQAKLILFADRLRHETPFTSFSSVLNLGLSGVRAGGGTALFDYLYLGVKRLEERQGRRVVVILSDGTDVESILPTEYVRWMVGQVQPVIYWIRLPGNRRADPASGASERSFWRSAEEHSGEIRRLEEMVEESGGRIEPIRRVEEAREAFRWILDDLRNQYVLGYFATDAESADGRHEVEVTLPVRRLDVRTRGSYLRSDTWRGLGSGGSP